jgi:hypothetical protein
VPPNLLLNQLRLKSRPSRTRTEGAGVLIRITFEGSRMEVMNLQVGYTGSHESATISPDAMASKIGCPPIPFYDTP